MIECHGPICRILNDHITESMERERAWNKATADLIRNHKAEVDRLRELVKEAYMEGLFDGIDGVTKRGEIVWDALGCVYCGEAWDDSDAKKALEAHDE